MEASNPKLSKKLNQLQRKDLSKNWTQSQTEASSITNLDNVIKRPVKCPLCDGYGKIYRNDIGARGIEYFYLEKCDTCHGKGQVTP